MGGNKTGKYHWPQDHEGSRDFTLRSSDAILLPAFPQGNSGPMSCTV